MQPLLVRNIRIVVRPQRRVMQRPVRRGTIRAGDDSAHDVELRRRVYRGVLLSYRVVLGDRVFVPRRVLLPFWCRGADAVRLPIALPRGVIRKRAHVLVDAVVHRLGLVQCVGRQHADAERVE